MSTGRGGTRNARMRFRIAIEERVEYPPNLFTAGSLSLSCITMPVGPEEVVLTIAAFAAAAALTEDALAAMAAEGFAYMGARTEDALAVEEGEFKTACCCCCCCRICC